MKNTMVLLWISLLFAATLQAQQIPRYKSYPDLKNKKNKHNWNISLKLLKQSGHHNNAKKQYAKTTSALAERLIATSTYDSYPMDTLTGSGARLGLIDSVKYKYSLSRSSTFDFNHMIFDPAFYFSGQLIMGFNTNIGFDNHNNQPAILFDSSWNYSYGFSAVYFIDTFALSDVQYALYDTNYNVTDWADLYLMDPTASYDENRYINTYDVHGNMLTSLALSWNMGVWDSTELRKFTYDAMNNVIEDSTSQYTGPGTWSLYEKWLYSFDDSGNLVHADYYDNGGTGGTWEYTEQYFMHYNSANKLTWDSVCQYDGSSWIPQASDTLGYTAGIDYVTYERSYSFSSGIPASYLYRTKHITAGLPDTLYIWETNCSDGTYIDKTKFAFTYDTYNEPLTCKEYIFNIDASGTDGYYDTTVDYTSYYYYETYYPRSTHHTGLTPVSSPAEDISVYPNPAVNQLTISRPYAAKGTYTSIKLLNAAGQVVRSESLPWLRQSETISLTGLTPGVYWIILQDKSGAVLHRQSVIKQ